MMMDVETKKDFDELRLNHRITEVDAWLHLSEQRERLSPVPHAHQRYFVTFDIKS